MDLKIAKIVSNTGIIMEPVLPFSSLNNTHIFAPKSPQIQPCTFLRDWISVAYHASSLTLHLCRLFCLRCILLEVTWMHGFYVRKDRPLVVLLRKLCDNKGEISKEIILIMVPWWILLSRHFITCFRDFQLKGVVLTGNGSSRNRENSLFILLRYSSAPYPALTITDPSCVTISLTMCPLPFFFFSICHLLFLGRISILFFMSICLTWHFLLWFIYFRNR